MEIEKELWKLRKEYSRECSNRNQHPWDAENTRNIKNHIKELERLLRH